MKTLARTFRIYSALIVICTLVFPSLTLAAGANVPVGKSLTEDQKILHVLNRLGFGARPGDVEKVRKMGLDKYIEQQLNPSSIDDSVADSKVKGLEIFNMSTAEIFEKYPNPGALLRQLNGGKKAQADKQAKADDKATANQQDPNTLTAEQQRQRRQELAELYQKYDLRPAGQLLPQIVANRVLRAVYSERQLQEVMVDFWQNHFNVFSGKNAVRWYIPSYERDVLRKYALGNFKDLLTATAMHPAMLFYLDNFQSVSPNSQAPGGNRAGNERLQQILRNGGQLPPQMRDRLRQRGITDAEIDARLRQMRNNPQPQAAKAKRQQRGINENYARELMELHTLGVDGGYTQKDIIEVAKAFTGWTIADPAGYRRAAARMITGEEDRRLDRLQRTTGVPDDLDSGQFYFNDRWHEKGPKYVLGQKIEEGGVKDGLKVIDILVNSPATAKFIARKLAVKFVSDNPSDALIGRVADAFHKSGGDIKTTLRALFTDKEFFAPENYRAKIKTPFELAVSSIRALGADTNGSPALLAMLNKLGEVPYGYQAPTGYPDKAEDWVNTGALLERMNFAIAIASNRIPGTTVSLKNLDGKNKDETLNNAINSLLSGEVADATRSTLRKQVEQPLPDVKPASEMTDNEMDASNMGGKGQGKGLNRQVRLLPASGDPEVFKVVSLVLGSPDFQRQ
ncbi:MAG TPA: DUF1800 domain-containing protein [Pyrinomonadaceae bacterium]|nr:DUF1800 domain-containing protein [Pyrinomonadaceae bacterium]